MARGVFTKFSLSKETFTALILSLESLCKLCEYLLNHCQFNYVLLGHVSSDNLEERFGWLRQLSGAYYYLSIRQLLENEKKIRCFSLMKYDNIFQIDDQPNVTNTSSDSDVQNNFSMLKEYIPQPEETAEPWIG